MASWPAGKNPPFLVESQRVEEAVPDVSAELFTEVFDLLLFHSSVSFSSVV